MEKGRYCIPHGRYAYPPILYSGTTWEWFDNHYRSWDGFLKAEWAAYIYAHTDIHDAASYPKHMEPIWTPTLLVIDTLKALQFIDKTYGPNVVAFRELPRSAFQVITCKGYKRTRFDRFDLADHRLRRRIRLLEAKILKQEEKALETYVV